MLKDERLNQPVYHNCNNQELKLGPTTNSPQSLRSSHVLPRCAETRLLISPSSTRFSVSGRSSRVTREPRQLSLTKLFRSSSRNRRRKTCRAAQCQAWSLLPVILLITQLEVSTGGGEIVSKTFPIFSVSPSKTENNCDTTGSSSNDESRNRTMLLQVGRSDLRLISPDTKQVLLHKSFREISHCACGLQNKECFGFICREIGHSQYLGYIFRLRETLPRVLKM